MGSVSSSTGEPALEKDPENENADATEIATLLQMPIHSRRSIIRVSPEDVLPEEDSIIEDLTMV